MEFTYVKKVMLQDVVQEYEDHKDHYYHRSVKHLKKYFNFLYEACLPVVMLRKEELSLREVQSFLESALLITSSKDKFYKNSVRKQLVTLGIECVPQVSVQDEKVVFDLMRTLLQLSFGDQKMQGQVVECLSGRGWDVQSLQSGYGHTVLENSIRSIQ